MAEERERIRKEEKLDRDLDELAAEGIACKVEGDAVVCNGEVIKTSQEEVIIDKSNFDPATVRKMLGDKSV